MHSSPLQCSLELPSAPQGLQPRCEGDLDGDGQVDVSDLLLVIAHWGTDGGGVCAADADSSGGVNVTDLLLVIAAWGSSCN